jgi:DnaJ-class molecular chaperone
MGLRVPLVDALVGFATTVEHVDGRRVPVEKASVTSCGSTMRLSGQGMPRRNAHGYGDLILTFTVEFPERLEGGDAQRAEIRNALGV